MGGRPSTRLFRFNGTISNLFVSTAPLSGDIIADLHNQAFSGNDISAISLTNTVRYCYQFQPLNRNADCYVDTSNFDDNNFRLVEKVSLDRGVDFCIKDLCKHYMSWGIRDNLYISCSSKQCYSVQVSISRAVCPCV